MHVLKLLSLFSVCGVLNAHIIILSNNDTHLDKVAAFGPRLNEHGIFGNMARVPKDSKEGCLVIEKAPCKDWIPIVERGGCSFVEKVRTLQKSGAKAVIIGDKLYNGWITMYATGDASDIIIPSVYVAQYQFLSLLQHLENDSSSAFIRITENEIFSWSYSDLFLFFAILLPSSIIYATYLIWRVRQDNLQEISTIHQAFVNLPIHSFHREKDIPIDECIICLEEYNEGDKIRTLPCKHFFHNSCIQAWLNRKQFCPICKYDICKNKYQPTERTPLLSA